MKPIYDVDSFVPHESIGAYIGRVRKAALDLAENELAPHGISGSEWFVILMVKNHIASAPTELCKMLVYDPGAMTRLIDRLEEKGLVRRLRAEDDRRAQRLELTAEGKAIYPKIVTALVKVYNQLLRGFTKTEVNQLQDMLKRMLANA